MNNKIDKIKKIRGLLLEQIADLTNEQLNTIPNGFNNNIIWNLTHSICAQQGICYLRGGQHAIVPDKFIAPFFTNTKPDLNIGTDEIQETKGIYISTIDQLQIDYDKAMFGNYTSLPNIFKVYGLETTGIEDTLEFVLYHEGYHSG
jgi:hypothetical protein